MRTTLLAITLAATSTVAAARQADPSAPPPMRGGMGMGGGMAAMMMHADTNHDGVVTREEALASSDQMFDRLDADKDGVVTADEMRAARDAMRPGGAPPADAATPAPPPVGAPGARGLSRQQWHDRALAQFDRFDANHDGRIDRTEIANAQEAARERRRERRGGGDTPPAPPPPGQQ